MAWWVSTSWLLNEEAVDDGGGLPGCLVHGAECVVALCVEDDGYYMDLYVCGLCVAGVCDGAGGHMVCDMEGWGGLVMGLEGVCFEVEDGEAAE